jgi:hypothetical protein
VGGGDNVDVAAVAAPFELIEASAPPDEVVDLEDLDVAAEERQ